MELVWSQAFAGRGNRAEGQISCMWAESYWGMTSFFRNALQKDECYQRVNLSLSTITLWNALGVRSRQRTVDPATYERCSAMWHFLTTFEENPSLDLAVFVGMFACVARQTPEWSKNTHTALPQTSESLHTLLLKPEMLIVAETWPIRNVYEKERCLWHPLTARGQEPSFLHE